MPTCEENLDFPIVAAGHDIVHVHLFLNSRLFVILRPVPILLDSDYILSRVVFVAVIFQILPDSDSFVPSDSNKVNVLLFSGNIRLVNTAQSSDFFVDLLGPLLNVRSV